MPTRKLNDWETVCRDPDHAPSMKVLDPGTYVHECSGCGRKSMFRIERPIWTATETFQWGVPNE